jgi:hypothetical protein
MNISKVTSPRVDVGCCTYFTVWVLRTSDCIKYNKHFPLLVFYWNMENQGKS